MFKRSLLFLVIVISLAVLGCSATKSMLPGMGGKTAANKIKDTDHPSFPDGVSCYVCHKEDMPSHEFHASFGNKCETCHVTTTWMAQKYPHDSWPLDSIHNVRCTRCHTQAASYNFAEYQCYGCHHTETGVKESHSKLNADSLTDCSACHKGFKENSKQ